MSEALFTTAAPNPRKQEAQTLCEKLDECLEANPHGGANPATLRQMETLGLHLKWTSSLFSEKVGSLLNWAAILYRGQLKKGKFTYAKDFRSREDTLSDHPTGLRMAR